MLDFLLLQHLAYAIGNQILKTIKYGDAGSNEKKFNGNLNIQDGDRPPFWIFNLHYLVEIVGS